jgi:hypothetical protein
VEDISTVDTYKKNDVLLSMKKSIEEKQEAIQFG